MSDGEFSSTTTINTNKSIVDPVYEAVSPASSSGGFFVVWLLFVILIFVFWVVVAYLLYKRYQNRQHFVTVQGQVPVAYTGHPTSQNVTIGNPRVTSPYSPYPTPRTVNTSHDTDPPPPYSPYPIAPSALSSPPPTYPGQQAPATNLEFSNPDLGSLSEKH